MKINKSIFAVLFILSFLLVCFYIFKSINIYFNESNHLYLNISSVFGNLVVCAIFLFSYVFQFKKDDFSKNKSILLSRAIPIFLLLLTVICLSSYNYLLLEKGFSTGKQLFFQIGSLIMAIGACYMFVRIQTKIKEISES